MSLRELEDEILTLAAHLYAGTCRWLELVAEFDRREGWRAFGGCRSCAEWIAWRCAVQPRAAREHLRVARRLAEIPLVHAAFAAGELSYAKVRALARVADEESEPELLELARMMTAAQLERTLRACRRVTTAEANDLHENAYVSTYWDADGSLVLHGRLAPEEGALFLCALDQARDSLAAPGRGSAEPRRRPTSAEALVAVAEASLASGAYEADGARSEIIVHVEADTLAADDEPGCVVEGAGAVAAETARRLACDGSVVTVSERNGRPVRAGRKTRTVHPALRRALGNRDRRCRFPGCDARRFLHAHHIQHWARGGETNLENLVLLCRRHHRLVHEGGYGVDRRLRFYDPRGRPILDAPPVGRGDLARLRGHPVQAAVGPETCAGGLGERLDLALAVDAIRSAARPRAA